MVIPWRSAGRAFAAQPTGALRNEWRLVDVARRLSTVARASCRTIATSTKAATVCAKVQIAFTCGATAPVPKVKASTTQATRIVMNRPDLPHVSAASSVASHRDGNGAYVGKKGLRIVATMRMAIHASGSRPAASGNR